VVAADDRTPGFKLQALKLLPFFYKMSEAIQRKVTENLEVFKALHIPLRSQEFPLNSAKDREHKEVLSEIVAAFQLSGSSHLMRFIATLFCKEESHQHAVLLQENVCKLKVNPDTQFNLLVSAYLLIKEQTQVSSQKYKLSVVREILVPLMQGADNVCLEKFFTKFISEIVNELALPMPTKSDDQLLVLTSKQSIFSMLQVMQLLLRLLIYLILLYISCL